MLHWIDTSIIFLFLAGLMGFGWWQSRLNITTSDYFLGGKTIPWIVAMFSIVATETSVLTFISIPGIAYRGNWLFLQLAIGYILGRILVALFLLPEYFNSGVTSIYELLGRKVKTIGELYSDPGIKTVNWDGKNDLGQKLGNGMYFAQPDKNSGLKMVKLVLIK